MENVARMSKDIRAAAATLSDKEARFLVDSYYNAQEDRIRASGRIRAMTESEEPHSVISWMEGQSSVIENQIKGALDRYSSAHSIGRWMKEIKGIGPVISAGYLANVDITKSNTAGKLWAICGVAPGRDRRVKGERLAYNPALKRLTWLVGQSFKRLSAGDEDAYYRHVYDRRKAYELGKNEAGDYAETAARILTEKKFGSDTKAKEFYSKGMLPPGHVDARAARYAAKMFLSDLQRAWWWHETGTEPPAPYPISIMGHADFIDAPHVRSFILAVDR